jgi:hypothetical protein
MEGAKMADKAPAWVDPVMRAGYAARAIVYVLVGGIAVRTAVLAGGGGAEGARGALRSLTDETWGQALLWVIAVGLVAYAVWRLIAAAMDLEQHGTDAKGVIARVGLVVTGLIHLGLAFVAARYALGSGGGSGGGGSGTGGSGGGSGGAQGLTAQLMQEDYGRFLVGAIGFIVIGAGVYYAGKGLGETYKKHLRPTETSERLTPICKAGLVAHGVAVCVIGGFFLWAAAAADPSRAGGLGKAFETAAAAPFGPWLVGALGLGFLCFAAYCMVEAVYRVIPRVEGDDMTTIAQKAERKAHRKARQAAA